MKIFKVVKHSTKNTKKHNFSVDIPSLDDEFILRFLYARKMNVENSFQLVLNYFAHRKNNPTLFENLTVNDPLTQTCLRDGLPLVLKNRDRYDKLQFFAVFCHEKLTFLLQERKMCCTFPHLSMGPFQVFGGYNLQSASFDHGILTGRRAKSNKWFCICR